MTASSPYCTVLAGGDVALNRQRAEGAFGKTAPLFRAADMAFANLEVPLSERGRGTPGKILLRGAPSMASALVEAGFDAMAFANNHAFDYGEEAFFDTLSLVPGRGIPLAGGGANLAEARKPVVVERHGLRIGVLCFCSVLPRACPAGPDKPGVNPLRALTAYRTSRDLDEYPGTAPEVITWAVPEDLDRMKADVRALKRRVDLVIVNHHWGTSMTHPVMGFQREIARATIDAGASLVLGGHPHVLQGVEFYKGVPIVYSMGNLIFDFDIPFFTEATRQTFLFGCSLGRDGARAPHLLPCRSAVWNAPKLLSPRRGEGAAIVRLVEGLSAPLGTKLKIQGEKVLLLPS